MTHRLAVLLSTLPFLVPTVLRLRSSMTSP